MSALPTPSSTATDDTASARPEARFEALTLDRLDAVLAVEQRAYSHPWTRGNFIDSLAAGYRAEVLVDTRAGLVGYYVAMAGVDEMHLLNLTVAPEHQGRGWGRGWSWRRGGCVLVAWRARLGLVDGDFSLGSHHGFVSTHHIGESCIFVVSFSSLVAGLACVSGSKRSSMSPAV